MTEPLGNHHYTVECLPSWVIGVRQYGFNDPFCAQDSVDEELTPTQSFEDEPDFPLDDSLCVDEEGEGYHLPVLRYPPVSMRCDTVYFDNHLNPVSVHGSQEIFVEDQYILKKHVMRYIDCEPYPATTKVVAVARDGKHIVWQQAIRSCTPTAISMIALDRGKQILAKEITYQVTSNHSLTKYIQKAGFNPVPYLFTGSGVKKVQALEKILAKTGPGLLLLSHPNLGAHVVVLDEISLERWSVTLREPYHGCMLTMKLFPFVDWIGEEFIEFADPH